MAASGTFGGADSRPAPQDKASIDDIEVVLLTGEDLEKGWHPCFLVDHRIDPGSQAHRAASERFGGWGYVARHDGKPCAFMGVTSKGIAYKDAGFFLPPGDGHMNTLLLTCFLGGGNCGPQYAGIGIMKKVVHKAVEDARSKGSKYVEGNPHDPGIGHLLARCGFQRIEWSGGGDSPNRGSACYRLELGQ